MLGHGANCALFALWGRTMFRRFRRPSKRKLLILGLDCVGADLLFRDLSLDLPNIQRLMAQGTWGQLDSSIPCITVPAWSSMTSGHDPGELGVYGFRNRAQYNYDDLYIADSRAIEHKRLWDYVGSAGLQSLVVNVPQTYPVSQIEGHLVSGFLTPNHDATFTYPAILKSQILKQASEYRFDVSDYRNVERGKLLQNIMDMTVDQYHVLAQLLTQKSWDFAMHVNIGTDRIHHAFWRYHDPDHRLHDPSHHLNSAIRDYYKLVDEQIGRILSLLQGDEVIMLVSDHGVKRMDGAICINEWLWQKGWLTFKTPPTVGTITPFDPANVDWSRTKAWSTGGYYGRVFLNIEGREPQGIIPRDAVPTVRDELAEHLRAIPDDQGRALNTTVYIPHETYHEVNRIAPDLMVYFGDLHWRVVGSVGYGRHYTLENDTGPDDANHAVEGMYLIVDPKQSGVGRSDTYQLMDVASTALHLMGLHVPQDLRGRVMSYRG
jgi:predicted AlkP superfamily phosphohydrolase/phosphomutase